MPVFKQFDMWLIITPMELNLFKVADNLLNREFYSNKPFEKLTTDVTQFNVCDDKVYLSPVMDLYNREIISYSISLSPSI